MVRAGTGRDLREGEGMQVEARQKMKMIPIGLGPPPGPELLWALSEGAWTWGWELE